MFAKDLERLRCVDVQNEFISRMYDNCTLAEACAYLRLNPAALGLIRKENVQFDNDIREAQAFCVELMTDRLENIHHEIHDPIMVSAVSKNIQWLASRRNRKIYGDKVDVQHNVTVNIRDAMAAARERSMIDVTTKQLDNNSNATDVVSVAQAPVIIDAEEIDPLS